MNKYVEEMIYWKIMRLTSQQIAHALILILLCLRTHTDIYLSYMYVSRWYKKIIYKWFRI